MLQTTPPKNLCKNCRHFVNDCALPFTLKYGKCRLTREEVPAVAVIDPIDGKNVKPSVTYKYASIERNVYGRCGEEGKLFEPETDFLKLLRNRYAIYVKTFTFILIYLFTYYFVSKL